jgi:predicted nucleotidyltransferase
MLDYLGILKRLNEAGVRYVVAGGVAVNLHGVPRMTYDLDLLVELTDDNLVRLVGLLEEWGFKPKVPVRLADLAVEEQRREWIEGKHMKAFCVVNDEWALSEIDILIDTPVGYAAAAENAARLVLGGVEIGVVSIDDLIVMKQGTGRAQDSADVEYLERVRDEDQR